MLASTPRAEILMALIAISIAAAFLFDGRALAPGVLEPVGPGTIPNATCWLAIALALAMLVRSVWGHHDAQPDASVAGERWGDLIVVVAATCAYVALLGFGLVRYSFVTAAFLAVSIVWLAENRKQALPGAVTVAIVMGFGLDYLFRHVLVTDLP